MRVAVTGGAGRLGRKIVADLLARNCAVVSLDQTPPPADQGCPYVRVDFRDFGETVGALSGVDSRHGGVDAVVHMASIPGPGHRPNPTLFANNLQSTYNIFEAARVAAIRTVVWASSEAAFGTPFSALPPLPIDETSPSLPSTTYGMVKVLEEQMAREFARWEPAMKLIALRFAWVVHEEHYASFAGFDTLREGRSLWSYVDARDAVQAVWLALEHQMSGFDVFMISSDDTVMPQDTKALLEGAYPDAVFRQPVGGREALFLNAKAKRVLRFRPRFTRPR